jgi:hypothetical protein
MEHLREAIAEAGRRYPHAADALAWLHVASGAATVSPNAADMAWAEAAIRAAAKEIKP